MLENRRFERVRLPRPLHGAAGGVTVTVVDLSISGVQLHHRDPLPPRDTRFTLHFRWQGSFFSAECSAAWTTTLASTSPTTDRPTLSSGIRFESVDEHSMAVLLEIIRAVNGDHHAAPAPPVAPPPTHTASEPFVMCELIEGDWRRRRTAQRAQPVHGFTISGAEDEAHIDRLCAAFAGGDQQTRNLIRTLATLTLKSHDESAAKGARSSVVREKQSPE